MNPTTTHSGEADPTRAEIPPASLDGWYVLHQVLRIDWTGLKEADPDDREQVLAELGTLLERWARDSDPGWSGVYRVAGGGVDLLALHFRDTLDRLMDAGRELQLSPIGDSLIIEEEYLSVVELGLYNLTVETAKRIDPSDTEAWTEALSGALEAERAKEFVQRRLYPLQPDHMPYLCFYPMDKRRSPDRNWYALSLEERAALMSAHGTVGRRYAGRISQVISGSMGLDDWEWAVTLWAADPLEFKRIISEMRYDRASAEYADFGPFLVGKRLSSEDTGDLVSVDGSP